MRVLAEGERGRGAPRASGKALEVAARGCDGRGPYANSMMGRSGLEVRGGCAADCKTRHDRLTSWLRRQRTLKSVVEDVERGDLFGGKAERNVGRGSVRSVGVGERRFMPQS